MKLSQGLFLVISDDPELSSTLTHLDPEMEIKVWVPSKQSKLQTQLMSVCEDDEDSNLLIRGDLNKTSFFKQFEDKDPMCVVLSLSDFDKYTLIRDVISDVLPKAQILTIQIGHPEEVPRAFRQNSQELLISWTELLNTPLQAELRHIETTHRVKRVREILDDAGRIALLLQPDPDPDGIAAALALRTILGRNKLSTPIVSFGKVTRPENMAMLNLLDLEITTISVNELKNFDKVVLLDTQPGHFSTELPRVDVVIDHHPATENYESQNIPYVDIRSKYGATSTILTEYLRAGAVNIGQRLATALLYGIKSDTLHLNRQVIDSDLYAFLTLYPKINYNLLRRIEKPEIPLRFAPILAKALIGMKWEDNLLVSSLGEVSREDLIPQIADFLLQFEDVEWVVCAGIYGEYVIVSVRNVGYVESAGEVVKKIVNGWGQGGGHRAMAKALFPIEEWKLKYKSISDSSLQTNLMDLFQKALK